MPEVASYSLLFYGSPTGYQTNRAQIQLSDANGQTLAWIRFNDPGMFFENDYESGGIIRHVSECVGCSPKRKTDPHLLCSGKGPPGHVGRAHRRRGVGPVGIRPTSSTAALPVSVRETGVSGVSRFRTEAVRPVDGDSAVRTPTPTVRR
jgi:hypothetical protein